MDRWCGKGRSMGDKIRLFAGRYIVAAIAWAAIATAPAARADGLDHIGAHPKETSKLLLPPFASLASAPSVGSAVIEGGQYVVVATGRVSVLIDANTGEVVKKAPILGINEAVSFFKNQQLSDALNITPDKMFDLLNLTPAKVNSDKFKFNGSVTDFIATYFQDETVRRKFETNLPYRVPNHVDAAEAAFAQCKAHAEQQMKVAKLQDYGTDEEIANYLIESGTTKKPDEVGRDVAIFKSLASAEMAAKYASAAERWRSHLVVDFNEQFDPIKATEKHFDYSKQLDPLQSQLQHDNNNKVDPKCPKCPTTAADPGQCCPKGD